MVIFFCTAFFLTELLSTFFSDSPSDARVQIWSRRKLCLWISLQFWKIRKNEEDEQFHGWKQFQFQKFRSRIIKINKWVSRRANNIPTHSGPKLKIKTYMALSLDCVFTSGSFCLLDISEVCYFWSRFS